MSSLTINTAEVEVEYNNEGSPILFIGEAAEIQLVCATLNNISDSPISKRNQVLLP